MTGKTPWFVFTVTATVPCRGGLAVAGRPTGRAAGSSGVFTKLHPAGVAGVAGDALDGGVLDGTDAWLDGVVEPVRLPPELNALNATTVPTTAATTTATMIAAIRLRRRSRRLRRSCWRTSLRLAASRRCWLVGTAQVLP